MVVQVAGGQNKGVVDQVQVLVGQVQVVAGQVQVVGNQVGYKFRGSIFESEEKTTLAVFIG